MAKSPQVLIVDQDARARFEVAQLVKQLQLVIAGESSLGTEAVSLASETSPDVIIVGISQPPDRSTRTIEALLDFLPETPVIAYGANGSADIVTRAMQAGARDFFVMPATAARLQQSVMLALEAEERRRLRLSGQAKAFGAQAMVISIYGAKGGVGKSTVAVNLGVALSQNLAQNAVIIDVDSTFGDVASMLEIKSDCNIIDFALKVEEMTRSSVTEHLVQHSSGLWVLPAPRDTLAWRSLSPERLHQVIALLSQRFDIVLLDTAAVVSEITLAALQDSGIVLWITSPDFSSVNNSLLGIETLEKLSFPVSRVRVLLNIISADDGVRPRTVAEALGRDLFWVLPYDREVHRGGESGQPVISTNPRSHGARSIVDLARAITGIEPVETPAPTGASRRGLRRILRGIKSAPEVAPGAGSGEQ